MLNFNRNETITICVDMKDHLEVQHIIDNDITTKGMIRNYIDDNKSYTGFETKSTVNDVVKLLKEKLNKSKIIVIGNLILIEEGLD